MTVDSNSWHARAFRWLNEKRMDPPESPTVCDYWGTIFIGIPLFCLFFALFSPVLLMVWFMVWLGEEVIGPRIPVWAKKSWCPFGRVNIR